MKTFRIHFIGDLIITPLCHTVNMHNMTAYGKKDCNEKRKTEYMSVSLIMCITYYTIIFILINHIQRYREDINIHITNTE